MPQVDTQNSGLLSSLAELIEAHRRVFRRVRTFIRCYCLVLGCLYALGRKTVSQLICALGVLEDDWTAWYRFLSKDRFDYDQMAGCFFEQTLSSVPADQWYATAADGTRLRRSSLTMPGTCWGRGIDTAKFKPGVCRQQRIENFCWLTPIEEGYSRAIPLRVVLASPQKAVPAQEPARPEWQAGLECLQWTRNQLDRLGRQEQTLLSVMDGSYDVNAIWEALPHETTLLVRCAKNRALYELPQEYVSGQHGAPCKYGARVPTPNDFLHEKGDWESADLSVRGRRFPVRCRVKGPFVVEKGAKQPVYLIVMGGTDRKVGNQRIKRDPSYLLVNARKSGDQWVMPAEPAKLLSYAFQRWEIEVCHREMKSSFGWGQMQCTSARGSLMSVKWMAWVYSLLVLAGYRAWNGLLNGQVHPPGGWWSGSRRWSFNSLWRGYRQELWGPLDFKAVLSVSLAKGPINQKWPQSLVNAVAGSILG